MKSKSKQGFTLIELLVVISIIGMLSSVVLASLSSARGKARDAVRRSNVKQLKTALEMYYSDYGKYPTCVNDRYMDGTGDSGSGSCLVAGSYAGLAAKLVPYYIRQIPSDQLSSWDNTEYAANRNAYGIRVRFEVLTSYTNSSGYCKTGFGDSDNWWSLQNYNCP